MDPQALNRDTLLDGPRFWCLLYEPWLLAYVGDPFSEGEEYFFSLPQSAVDEFFRELETMAVDNGVFPTVSVLVSLANGWPAGLDTRRWLSSFPPCRPVAAARVASAW